MLKTIAHISDLHFGAIAAPDRADELLEALDRIRPDVVAVSGDLTQRAREWQFRQARHFLDRIKFPKVVVPGNHDVPLWNVFKRFGSPLGGYRRWISDNLSPLYVDEALAILGIDTTRSFTIKGGDVGRDDLEQVKNLLCILPPDHCKVVVAHHPFIAPPNFSREKTVRGVREALKLFEQCGVEIVLTGHLHQSHASDSVPGSPRSILLVQAGTASSSRGRGTEVMKNSFNLLTVSDTGIGLKHLVYSEGKKDFVPDSGLTRKRCMKAPENCATGLADSEQPESLNEGH